MSRSFGMRTLRMLPLELHDGNVLRSTAVDFHVPLVCFWRFKWRRGPSHSSQKQEKHFTFSFAPSLDRYPIQWKHSATQNGQTLACLSGRYGIPWNGLLWRALEQLQLCPIRPNTFWWIILWRKVKSSLFQKWQCPDRCTRESHMNIWSGTSSFCNILWVQNQKVH